MKHSMCSLNVSIASTGLSVIFYLKLTILYEQTEYVEQSRHNQRVYVQYIVILEIICLQWCYYSEKSYTSIYIYILKSKFVFDTFSPHFQDSKIFITTCRELKQELHPRCAPFRVAIKRQYGSTNISKILSMLQQKQQ